MKHNTYIEVTYRGGKALAAYIHLSRRGATRVARTRKAAPGLVVDYAADGTPLGIEITCPRSVTVESINALMRELQLEALPDDQLAPLTVGSEARPVPTR